MKINNSKKAIVTIITVLFIIGMAIGASIAYKEDTGNNLPIPILMIFLISIGFVFYKQFSKSL